MQPVFLDFLFPRKSLTGAYGSWISQRELARLRGQPIVENVQHLRLRSVEYLDRLVAAADYKSSPMLQRSLHLLKYQRVTEVEKYLSQLLCDAVTKEIPKHPFLLVPVPLHWSRQFDRGFNQAELFARTLSENFFLKYEQVLKRIRPTGHQAWRKRSDRIEAMNEAFKLRKKYRKNSSLLPRHVVLVDDISTTGATLDACAHALKKFGVQRVDGWVIARG